MFQMTNLKVFSGSQLPASLLLWELFHNGECPSEGLLVTTEPSPPRSICLQKGTESRTAPNLVMEFLSADQISACDVLGLQKPMYCYLVPASSHVCVF